MKNILIFLILLAIPALILFAKVNSSVHDLFIAQYRGIADGFALEGNFILAVTIFAIICNGVIGLLQFLKKSWVRAVSGILSALVVLIVSSKEVVSDKDWREFRNASASIEGLLNKYERVINVDDEITDREIKELQDNYEPKIEDIIWKMQNLQSEFRIDSGLPIDKIATRSGWVPNLVSTAHAGGLPGWIDNIPKSRSLLFAIGRGEGATILSAQEQAERNAIAQITREAEKFLIDLESKCKYCLNILRGNNNYVNFRNDFLKMIGTENYGSIDTQSKGGRGSYAKLEDDFLEKVSSRPRVFRAYALVSLNRNAMVRVMVRLLVSSAQLKVDSYRLHKVLQQNGSTYAQNIAR